MLLFYNIYRSEVIMKNILKILVLTCFSSIVFAQICLFDENDSGFDIHYYKGTGPRINLNSFTVGYTINGRLNIGIDVNNYNYWDNNLYGFDLHLELSLIKQNEKMPINLIAGIYYDYNFDQISELDVIYKFLGFKTGISHSFKIGDDIRICPIAELQILYEDRLEYGSGYVNYLLKPLIKCTINYKNIFIYPELSYSSGYYFFSGGIGFIIPTNPKIKE